MTRPDPYQDRARELCLEAGVDPDSRVERPGLRSMQAKPLNFRHTRCK
jgi:hypothetical protein